MEGVVSPLHVFKSLWIEYLKRVLGAAVFIARHQVALWLAANQLTSWTLLLQKLCLRHEALAHSGRPMGMTMRRPKGTARPRWALTKMML